MPELARTVAEGFAERIREQEDAWLSPLAVRSYETRGRAEPEDESDLRTPFQRDRDRIVHSKAFRRLKHKTQVFVAPEGDHYRTRLTHTLEAAGSRARVARALRLNEDLTEAIGLGHDLGHPPFGHAGEEALDALLRERCGSGFRHNEHSLRVVDVLERDGRGLNLTEQVRDGILNHTGREQAGDAGGPDRQARRPRRLHQPRHRRRAARRAARAGRPARAPRSSCSATPARTASTPSCTTSSSAPAAAGDIVQSEEIGGAMLRLRKFMFDRVYLGAAARTRARARRRVDAAALRPLWSAPRGAPAGDRRETAERVTDYLAGMTDRYCIASTRRARP